MTSIISLYMLHMVFITLRLMASIIVPKMFQIQPFTALILALRLELLNTARIVALIPAQILFRMAGTAIKSRIIQSFIQTICYIPLTIRPKLSIRNTLILLHRDLEQYIIMLTIRNTLILLHRDMEQCIIMLTIPFSFLILKHPLVYLRMSALCVQLMTPLVIINGLEGI
jgi:hypothetical protein